MTPGIARSRNSMMVAVKFPAERKKKNANPRNKDLKSLKLSSFYLTYTSTLQVIEHPFLERWYVTDTDRSILLCYLWSCPFNCML